jgi:cyclin B
VPAARNPAAASRRSAAPPPASQAHNPSTAEQKQPRQQPVQQQQQQQQGSQQQLLPVQQEQRQRPAALPPLPDIDGLDKHNPLAECQYVNDIYGYFRQVEPKYRAPANYMESQVRDAAGSHSWQGDGTAAGRKQHASASNCLLLQRRPVC